MLSLFLKGDMMYTPLNYNQINIAAGTTNPSSVKSFNNKTFAFWERSLFHRAQSVLDINVPSAWDGKTKDFFKYCLFKYGFVAISYDSNYGYYFQPCTLSGYDLYYQPTDAIITNPVFNGSKQLKISSECELLKLTPDYMGVWDIISYTAEKLSTLDNAINMSIINNKFAFILGARNKTASAALKKILDLVNRGEPAVVYDMKLINDPTDKEMPFQQWERKLKDSYITSDQLQDFQTILNNFDAEIGIPTIPYQKKERMVTNEADARSYDAKARSITWFNTLTSSIKEVKALYPDLNLSVKLHYDETEGTPEDIDVKGVTVNE